MKDLRQILLISFVSAVSGATAGALITPGQSFYSRDSHLYIPTELESCKTGVILHQGAKMYCIDSNQLPADIAVQIATEKTKNESAGKQFLQELDLSSPIP